MSRKRKTVFWSSLVLIGLVAASVAFVSARGKRAVAAQQRVPEFKQRIRIWIHGDDVRPNVIHAWPGPALVTVENETSADVSLRVARVLPNRIDPLGTITVPAQSRRLQREVNLAVGEYVFYELGRSGIRGRLIVEPR